MSTVVFPAENSNTPFHLVQATTLLIIHSNCCRCEIKIQDKSGGEYTYGDIHCRGCKKKLMGNPKGWLSVIDLNKHNNSTHAPNTWNEWGSFWFGVKDYAMSVRT